LRLNNTPPVYPRVWIRGPVVPGNRVFREPHPTHAFHKWEQFINPDGEDFCREVELTETFQMALAKGEIELCSAPGADAVRNEAPAAAPKPEPAGKADAPKAVQPLTDEE
jgi:hypothetical protein